MTAEDLLKDVALRFSTDSRPGFTRKVKGKHFEYFDRDGKKIRDENVIDRINKLVIPPAYTKVWICPFANGHMQATGYDARGRKQYRYHPLWNKMSQEEKFSRLSDFAKHLPQIRSKIQRDLSLEKLPRQKVIAAVVYLLENTLIRIGNEEYAQENNSYGLTTLRNRHVSVTESRIKFQFKGKSGVYHKVTIKNKKIAKIVRHCRELPGQDLFEYFDDEGMVQPISSQDVNEYLQAITGTDVTAKDFRTWGGTIIAADEFDRAGILEDENLIKKTVVETVRRVAEHLRNKPATCRKYYIHPHVIDAYIKGVTLSTIKSSAEKINGLYTHENEILALLRHMARAEKNA